MRRVVGAVTMCLALTGCLRVVVDSPAARSGQSNSSSGVSFVGLTTVTADASECRYGIAKVETKMPFWGWLIGVITMGIVPGMEAEYYCAAPPTPAAVPQQPHVQPQAEQERSAAEAEAQRRAAQEQAEARQRAAQEQAAAEAAQRKADAEAAAAQHRAAVEEMKRVPLAHAALRIVNAYTASIFRVDVDLPDTEEGSRVLDEVRVNAATTKVFAGTIYGRPGQRTVIHIGVMSMGEWHAFEVDDVVVKPGGAFTIAYDWDSATADFRIRTGWN